MAVNVTINVFPEEKIPEVIAVIRAGLIAHQGVSAETRTQLHKQCDKLEKYHKRRLTEDE